MDVDGGSDTTSILASLLSFCQPNAGRAWLPGSQDPFIGKAKKRKEQGRAAIAKQDFRQEQDSEIFK